MYFNSSDSAKETQSVSKYNRQIATLIKNISLDFSAMINDTYNVKPSEPKATFEGVCFELRINSTADNKESSNLAKLSKRSIQLKFRIQSHWDLIGDTLREMPDEYLVLLDPSGRGNYYYYYDELLYKGGTHLTM